jgi:HlyD family secretion protein
MVQPGDVLARMDTVELEAQLAAAKAQVTKAQSEKTMAEAQIVERIAGRAYAEQEYQRYSLTAAQGWTTKETLDKYTSERLRPGRPKSRASRRNSRIDSGRPGRRAYSIQTGGARCGYHILG